MRERRHDERDGLLDDSGWAADGERSMMITRLRRIAVALSVATIIATIMAAAASPARATEPRPWLCRDKPVFSSGQPMTYDLSLRGGGRWVMIFMRFDP